MKQTINRSDFERAFKDMNRLDNFSYEGIGLLFSYLEDYEQSTGEEIELDVVALCCEYFEDEVRAIAESYSVDLSECEDEGEERDAVRDYLQDNTSIVGETVDGFVYAVF